MSKQQELITRQEQLPAQATIYEVFASMARDPSIEPARIAQLMELHERAEARQAQREFIAAMNRVQQRLKDFRITKRGRIEFTSKNTGVAQSTPYAKYEDVWHVVGPILLEEGFTVSFGTAPVDKGGITISATIHHSAGHTETNSMPLPFDTSGSKNSIQAVGSTLSYGKRYLLFAALNLIAEGEDNDGAGMGYVSEQQTNTIIDMMAACEMDQNSQSKFLELMQSESVSEIQKRDYPKAMSLLQAKLKKLRGAQ